MNPVKFVIVEHNLSKGSTGYVTRVNYVNPRYSVTQNKSVAKRYTDESNIPSEIDYLMRIASYMGKNCVFTYEGV